MVDFKKQQMEHPSIHIMGLQWKVRFLGVHITDKLKWSTNTDIVVKKAQQRLFNLRRLKKFSLHLKASNFYRCTIESILSDCTVLNHKALQGVVCSAKRIPGGKLPALHDTYSTCRHRKAKNIIIGQQPPEPLPVHHATIQKVRSVQVHQSWDQETEKQLLSQGHQTIKQPSLQRLPT